MCFICCPSFPVPFLCLQIAFSSPLPSQKLLNFESLQSTNMQSFQLILKRKYMKRKKKSKDIPGSSKIWLVYLACSKVPERMSNRIPY